MTDSEETGLLAFESRRLGGRKWAVAAAQYTANSFGTDLLANAYCDRDARRAKSAMATRSVVSGETRSVAARCPRGHRRWPAASPCPPTKG
jgi:hypothetical protein